jgi:selenocysteine lyase/cysteine desulfurase
LKNEEQREEAGTPNIVGDIRAGLLFQLKSAIGINKIMDREREITKYCKTIKIYKNKYKKNKSLFY